MGMGQLLFGFNGRINRKQYWLAGLGAGALCGVLGGLLSAALSDAPVAAMFALLAAALPLHWITIALNVKRFHDRGRTGYLALAPLVPAFMIVTTIVTSLTSIEAFFGALMQSMLWLGVLGAIQIWFFVDLGLLPGQEGPNRFDHTPAGPSPAPRAPVQTMGAAAAAMERALAEQKLRAAAPAPAARAATPMRQPSAGQPSFGRRPAH